MIRYENLFVECTTCNGTGSEDERAPGRTGRMFTGTCRKCGGFRGQLTPQGEEIKKFMDQVQRPRSI